MQPWQVVAIVTIYDITKSLVTKYLNWKNETVEDGSETEETNEIDDVLDRIETDIKANMYDLYKNQDICAGMEMTLDIIEKYKTEIITAESEEIDNDSN